ncbi:MAG: glutamyl-tRNA amidotransferase [Leptolyngbya sp. SIO1D8]|nr:glutamyl-tRNA amidotransferase [Leptolyngbya sp. SIO1D8]
MGRTFKLAVNGTLMQGLALNPNLLNVGATLAYEAQTEAAYRLWSIDDQYPAMIRVAEGGVAIAVEVWHVPAAGLGVILSQEPPGLAIGKVKLADGEVVLGVIGEPLTVQGKPEITQFGGWRAYQASLS